MSFAKDLINMKIDEQVAIDLLEIEAVKLRPNEPFTWSSGWKSPIYCDNRLTLSYPEIRTRIKEAFKQKINQLYPNVESIAGVATAGIPQGALVADILDLPFIYVRSKPKGHGMTNMIEGEIRKGQKVVVIEDLISTGGSSIKAIEALREGGLEVLGLGAIFTYGFPQADENFDKKNIQYFTLSDYAVMLDVALRNKYITSTDLNSLNSWREQPDAWGN